MKILWLCNVMLPMIAKQLHMEASNKEGWLSGLADAVLEQKKENRIALSVAFPVGKNFSTAECLANQNGKLLKNGAFRFAVSAKNAEIICYGFPEDVSRAECYDESLEDSLRSIVEDAEPDLVHCFGTEYPHTLAMCRVFPKKDRILAGLQGLCTLCAKAYYADLPGKVIHSVTFRDYLKQDSLIQQQKKFVKRGEREQEAIRLAGNITGRTRWDKEITQNWNPKAHYFHMDETLRKEFYGPVWEEEKCISHTIFVSQGDYPLKGLHYVLSALPAVIDRYPDTRVYVAGNSIVKNNTVKEWLKLSAYGKHLIRLMERNTLEERVTFLGKLSAEQMRDRYLVSHLYLCPSTLENSPNSLGEAMLLGMPCVAADVGGIPSLFTGDRDGILYEGFQMEGMDDSQEEFRRVSENLAEAINRMWENPEKMREYCTNARKRALETHDQNKNYRRLMEIYEEICSHA